MGRRTIKRNIVDDFLGLGVKGGEDKNVVYQRTSMIIIIIV